MGTGQYRKHHNRKRAAFTFCAMAVVIMASVFGDPDAESMALDLNRFRWQNRLLFLFAPAADDPAFAAVHGEIAAQKDEMDDRDLVVFEILESGPSRMTTTWIDPQTATSLRKRFSVPPKKFTLILLGKDGGLKLRRNAHVRLEEIFALIDSMPMRKDEMRQKGRNF